MQKTLEMQIQFLGQGDPLEKEMATHSSILAWRIPWAEEPGRLILGVRKSQTQLSIHVHMSLEELILTTYENSPGEYFCRAI